MEKLKRYFGHAYHAKEQPAHPDFPLDWQLPETRLLYRAVFVGSKISLESPALTSEIPNRQARYESRR
jgi:hypothetical protein